MKSKLDLILKVEIGTWEEPQQFREVDRKLIPQISFDQVRDG